MTNTFYWKTLFCPIQGMPGFGGRKPVENVPIIANTWYLVPGAGAFVFCADVKPGLPSGNIRCICPFMIVSKSYTMKIYLI